VVIGFLTGVSINVILSQLGDFTGYSSEYSNKVVKAVDTLLHFIRSMCRRLPSVC